MRKYLMVLSAAVMTLVFTGCQTAVPNNEPQKPAEPQADQKSADEFTKDFSYKCADEKTFAVKMNGAGDKVLFIETGKEPLLLPQTIAASGIRYSDERTIFWAKGDTAFVETADGTRLYDDCALSSGAAAKESEEQEPGSRIANPASQNCLKKGGTLEIRSGKKGEYGVCLFEDNRQCEEWALLRGQCPEGGRKITGYDNDAEIYCAITGGQVEGVGTETPMCKRIDGTYCNAQANLDGDCPDPSDPSPNAGNVEAP